MASNIDIQKKCEWCGKLFIAHKTSTRCCSHRCANLAYKERIRQKRVSEFQTMVNQQIEKEDCIDKDFLTPSEAAKYIGISRATSSTYEIVPPNSEMIKRMKEENERRRPKMYEQDSTI